MIREITSKTKFATLISCIDGRVQDPLQDWIRAKYDVEFVDTITEPGVDKILSEHDAETIESIKSKVSISINAHNSHIIVVSGHYNCAANPVDQKEHKNQIQESLDIVKSWGLNVLVIGAWVNSAWEVEEL